ncbi:MAG TPA: helix-turn-helix transcriptional regulator [Chitinophagales bacterium]|nr:helix-turn-helix transcriptional regulator [Chitinophagales bacterium]
MNISARIRKIREISGWKQSAVASSLNISQQAYSCLEKGADTAKIETLLNFCNVMNIKLSYLTADDIDITEESLREFGSKGFADVLEGYRKMNQRVAVYQEILSGEINKWETNPMRTAGTAA